MKSRCGQVKALGLIGCKIADDSCGSDGGRSIDWMDTALSICAKFLFGKTFQKEAYYQSDGPGF
jgi:hypothetical protein